MLNAKLVLPMGELMFLFFQRIILLNLEIGYTVYAHNKQRRLISTKCYIIWDLLQFLTHLFVSNGKMRKIPNHF